MEDFCHRGTYVIVFSSFLAFVALSLSVWVGLDFILAIDSWWLDSMVSLERPSLTTFFSNATHMGSAYLLYPLALVILCIMRKRMAGQYARLLASMALSSIIINVLKVSFDKDRPVNALLDLSRYSYPSGHASLAVVFSFGLFYILYKSGIFGRGAYLLLATSFSILVAFSRTYLRVHYLSDVVGAALIGIALFTIFFSYYFDRNTF